MKNFIVFCFARTGSYRLIDVLNHQDDVIAYGEIFKPNSFEVSQDILEQINYEKSNFLKRDKAPIHFYKKLARLHEDKKFGFKIFPNHNDRVLKYLAKHEDIIKIFLVRNPVQTYISEKVARASDQWVVKEGFKRRNSEVTVKFDVESFSQHLRYRIAWYSYIKSLSTLSGSKIHTIDYFDSLDDDYLNNFFNSIGT
ncbi:hypothetical protein [Psychrobacter sp. WY6]|uniref:hypothetical protein n=1 Tax=Psychrobacter sp. WY6 TaxID=2708350 RepID=UPI002022C6E4|nr:hypothetical protein [Psychrobacter sp. WY6]